MVVGYNCKMYILENFLSIFSSSILVINLLDGILIQLGVVCLNVLYDSQQKPKNVRDSNPETLYYNIFHNLAILVT